MGVGKDQIMMYFKNKTGVSLINKITESNYKSAQGSAKAYY